MESTQARRAWFGTTHGLVVLALGVGVGAGLGAIAFRELIVGLTHVFSGHGDPSGLGRVTNPHVPGLGVFFVVLAPIVGGLAYGPLVARFAPEARGHGVPEVMLAVAEFGGRIRPQVPIVKALASALCIGSGGSVGPRGPHRADRLRAGLGARPGRARARATVAAAGRLRRGGRHLGDVQRADRRRLLRAGGHPARLRDELLRRRRAQLGHGSAVARAVFGSDELPAPARRSRCVSPVELVLYAGLGVLAGAIGVAFIRVLYGSEDVADRVWRGPEWARPAVGGAAARPAAPRVPQLYGVGYPVLAKAVGGTTSSRSSSLLLWPRSWPRA